MIQNRKLSPVGEIAVIITLVLGWNESSFASANPIISTRNSSDPQARVFDGKLYLYTSSDMNQSGNWPMNKTYCYTLKDGKDPFDPNSWDSGVEVLSESAYGWVAGSPNPANHLWAPDAFKGDDGKYYLFVPDIDKNYKDLSRVGVSTSSSPTGPFTVPTGMTAANNYIPNGTTYTSDPSVFKDPNDGNGQLYLVYANGGFDACGHLSIAKLDKNMTSISGAQEIQWTNASSIPTTTKCSPAYMEGAELDYFGGKGTDGNGKYFLSFAIKDNESNTESIAYGIADKPMGPYTYVGLIMSGQGGTGWTNQASIVLWKNYYLLFYHNDPTNGTNPNRRVFLECVDIRDGKIGTVTRTNKTSLSNCTTATNPATGGVSSGGTSASTNIGLGGTGQGGAVNGGTSARGGTNAAGGSKSSMPTGGTRASSSSILPSGGNSASGGSSYVTDVGGALGLGGTVATSSVTIYAVSTGGTDNNVVTTGGIVGNGGSWSITATSTGTTTSGDSGCNCRLTASKEQSSTRTLGVFALGLLAFIRRRRA